MSEELLKCPECNFILGMEGGSLIGGYRLDCPACDWHSKTYETENDAYYKGATDER